MQELIGKSVHANVNKKEAEVTPKDQQLEEEQVMHVPKFFKNHELEMLLVAIPNVATCYCLA